MSFASRLRRIFSNQFLIFTFSSIFLFQFSIKSADAFPADFDGDGKNDLAVWRPSGVDQGKWFVMPSSGTCPKIMCTPSTAPCAPYYYGGCVFQWGLTGDQPISGDFDVDGKADFTVFRQSNLTWYIFYSSGSSVTVSFAGGGGDLIDEADINGDGRSEMILMTNPYGNNQATLSVRYYTPAQGIVVVSYVVGLENPGVGISEVTLQSANYKNTSPNPEPAFSWYRTVNFATYDYLERWQERNTDIGSGAQQPLSDRYMNTGHHPFPILKRGDFGGNVANLSDFTSWTPWTGTWRTDFNGGAPAPVTTQWGLNGDVPLTGKFDSDQIADYMVWRPGSGIWYLKPSSGTCPKMFCTPNTAPCATFYYGGCYKQWGLSGDVPVD